MGNIAYTEPKSVDVACEVMGDVIMAAASSKRGGFSVRIDDFLAPYCKKSFDNYYQEYLNIVEENCALKGAFSADKAYEYAEKKTRRELEQGLQGLEIKLNSVAYSRGDYTFVSMVLGEYSFK